MDRSMNIQLAETITSGALEVVKRKIETEKLANGFSIETYYVIEQPFAAGTAEHDYYIDLIEKGTAKDERYVDLFAKVMQIMTEALKKEDVKSFVTLNCRFNPGLEDNFLLYVFASWKQ